MAINGVRDKSQQVGGDRDAADYEGYVTAGGGGERRQEHE